MRNRLFLPLLALVFAGFVIGLNPLWLTAAPGDLEEEAALPSKNEVLADVRIEGNTTIPAKVISRFIKARAGRPLSERQIREDKKALWETRWFTHVESIVRRTEKGLVLVYRVPERPVVRRVEYRGLKKIKQKELEDLTGLKPGSPFDVSLNREARHRIESHLKEKGFTFASVELMRGDQKEHRDVIYQIDEGSKVRVSAIDFQGNDLASDGVLKTKISTKSAILWMIGGMYDPSTIPEDIVALKQYYHSLGYFDVKVTHKERLNDSKSRVYIDYIIEEGPRYKIRDLVIKGNDIFSTDELREMMSLSPGDEFNARHLAKDVNKVKNEYDSLGRIGAIVNAAPVYLEEKGIADLVYEINEDKVYRIRRTDVTIRGDHSHTKRMVVLNRIGIRPGELASRQKILLAKSRLGGSIFESAMTSPEKGPSVSVVPVTQDGFPGGQQSVRLQNDDFLPPSMLDLQQFPFSYRRFSVPKRKQTTSSKSHTEIRRDSNLTATGHSLPDEIVQVGQRELDNTIDVVRRDDYVLPFQNTPSPAFHLKAPAYLPDSQIIRAQNMQDGIRQPGNPAFGSSPQGDPFAEGFREPPTEGELDLHFGVDEARTGRLMFGVGVNSNAGVVGSIVLSEQNFDILRPPTGFHDLGTAFRGGGQRFRAEAIPGNVVSRYSVNWTDPYFMDTDFSLSLSGFYYNRFFDDWDEQRSGGRVAVGYQFSPQFSMTATVRMEEVVVDNPDLPTPPILAQAVGSNYLSTARLALTHDTRDSQFFPGEGHFLEASYEQAFGDFIYPRFEGSARKYITTYSRPDEGGRHILTLAAQLGWTGDDTPIFENFFAGGFQSFRGFDFRGVGPRQFSVSTGGRWMALGTVEYQIPLLANESIQGVVFSDFGTVENDIGMDDFRLSVGTGLRIQVPGMGPVPLAFDFAFPIMSQNFDEERVFSFYVDVNQ